MKTITLPLNYLIETPISQLYSNTINDFDTPRQQSSGRVQVISKEFIPAVRNGILTVKAVTRSSAKQYETRISFRGVDYVVDEEEEPVDSFTFTAADGQDYIILPVSENNTDVQVNCSCLDFYYRFSVWNSQDGSLLGQPPPPYIKKTDREPVNPNGVAGLCKHLIALTDDLERENLIR